MTSRSDWTACRSSVELETGDFTLSRRVRSGTNTVRISAADGVRRDLKVRGRGEAQTASDWLLDNVGIPRVRLRTGSSRRSAAARRYARVSFGDVFRYMYLEQAEIDRSTVRNLDTVLDGRRRRAFEVIYGLTGPEIAELEAEAERLAEAAERFRSRTEAVDSFLSGTDPGGSLERSRAEMRQVEGQRAAAAQHLAALRSNAREASVATYGLREDLQQIEYRIVVARRERAERVAQVDRLRLARAGAVVDHQKSILAASAQTVFVGIDYQECPRCLQSLAIDHDASLCVVCRQPEPEPVTTHALAAERARLEQQIMETDGLLYEATESTDAIDRDIDELESAARATRLRLGHQASEAVAPFVESIAQLTAEVAGLEERRRAIEATIKQFAQLEHLRAESAKLADEQAAKERQLAVARAARDHARERVGDFSTNFTQTIERFEPPCSSHIDTKTYLPVVDDSGLEGKSAGVKTLINDAYYLANLMTALQQQEAIHLPGFLMIDSPRKNFGHGLQDRNAGDRVYSTIDAIRAANGDDLQILIADNDLPKKWRKPFRVISLSYDEPLVARLRHPGRESVQTLDQTMKAERESV